MRQNYDITEYGSIQSYTITECTNVPAPTFKSTAVGKRYKYGSSGTSTVRPNGSRPPCSCDIGEGQLFVQPSVTKGTPSVCGYYFVSGQLVPRYATVYSEHTTGFLRCSDYYSNLVPQSVRDDAARRFYKDVAEFKFNLAADLAQYQQTIDMVADTALALGRAMKGIKNGNLKAVGDALGIKAPKDLPKQLSSAWLQLQYGWKPLLSDVHEALTLLDSSPMQKQFRSTHRASTTIPPIMGDLGDWPHRKGGSALDKVTTTCLVTVVDADRLRLSQLGLDNPALLAWELLPFSFVADWFYPIGPWLEAQTAMSGISISDFSVTYTRELTLLVQSLPPNYTRAGIISGYERRKQRSCVIPTLPSPQLIPPITSLTRLGNAVALLTQLVTGKK